MIKKTANFIISITILAAVLSCNTVDDEKLHFETSDDPAPYEEDEFSDWLKDLRRAEIIFFGSFPFSMILTNLGAGAIDLILSDGGAGYDITDFNSASSMTDEKKQQILLISGGISAGITLTDYILGLISKEKADEQPAQ